MAVHGEFLRARLLLLDLHSYLVESEYLDDDAARRGVLRKRIREVLG
jgi:hypothetical protein